MKCAFIMLYNVYFNSGKFTIQSLEDLINYDIEIQ